METETSEEMNTNNTDFLIGDRSNGILITDNYMNNTNYSLLEFYDKTFQGDVVFKYIVFCVGIVIVIINFTVVLSSGLILKKGQQPKSTYMLLGNVSLADTIVGLSIMFTAMASNNVKSSSPMCIFRVGILVCPAMVSIFSVGMIAVDRYFYILHGLYYQRWFSTTRVRISILCIWIISIALSFMPATGFVNRELESSRCYYMSLFPGSLILLNSLLSVVPIIVVVILYSIILVHALRNVKNIKATKKSIKNPDTQPTPTFRIYRGKANTTKNNHVINKTKLKRSASINNGKCFNSNQKTEQNKMNVKSKSVSDLTSHNNNNTTQENNNEHDTNNTGETNITGVETDSKFSIYSIDSGHSEMNQSVSDVTDPEKCERGWNRIRKCKRRCNKNEPNKWRAITVVMLTTGSFMVTWLPFFVTAIFFTLCEEKLTNPRCTKLRLLLGRPLAILAFLNSILNPLIYAWWHKGFQRTVKNLFRYHFRKCFVKVQNLNL